MNLVQSSSHCWWLDSQKTPTQSGWLQSTLGGLDEKMKTMMKLVNEDADSFAKRAEMYYKKRPELVSLIEEFYGAYRSLAVRYDHLQGEIGQNIPKGVQVPCDLSCDSYEGSTLGKGNLKKEIQGSEKSLIRCGSCNSDDVDSEISEVEDPEPGDLLEGDGKDNDQILLISDSELENPCQAIEMLLMELQELREEKRRMKDRSRFVLAENKDVCSRMRQMQMTIIKLEEGKQKLLEQLSAKSFQCRELENQIIQLKKDMDSLKEENMPLSLQNNRLVKELHTFEAENGTLMEQNIDEIYYKKI